MEGGKEQERRDQEVCGAHIGTSEEEDFEFSVEIGAAKNSFAGGDVSFPLFGRNMQKNLRALTIVKRDEGPPAPSSDPALHVSASSSECDDLEAPSEGTYCVWPRTRSSARPAFARQRRSASMGSEVPTPWRIRDLVVGRSASDGHVMSRFFSPPPPTPPSTSSKQPAKEGKKGGKVIEMDILKAHNLFYARKAEGAAGSSSVRSCPTAARWLACLETRQIANHSEGNSSLRFFPSVQLLMGLSFENYITI